MLRTLLEFFAAAADQARNDAGASRYHHWIVGAGFLGGVGLAALGTGALFWNGYPAGQPPKILLAPVAFFMAGCLFGVAMACTFAPRKFLEGPSGQQWMKLIGTESIITARIACALLTLVALGVLSMFAWGAWKDYEREQIEAGHRDRHSAVQIELSEPVPTAVSRSRRVHAAPGATGGLEPLNHSRRRCQQYWGRRTCRFVKELAASYKQPRSTRSQPSA